MNKAELQAKIAKMEKGLANEAIQGAARAALEASLKKAKGQLADMEKPSPEPAAGPKPKPAAKRRPAPVKKDPKAKKTPAPSTMRKKPASKPRAVASDHSFQKQTKTGLAPMTFHCELQYIRVSKDTPVTVKGTGRQGIKVTARKGEYLVFDQMGRLMMVMTAHSFEQKCVIKKSVKQHVKDDHKPKAKPQPSKGPAKKTPPAASKKKTPTPRKKAPKTKTKTRRSPVQSILKEINDIRRAQNKRPLDRDKLRKEYSELIKKKDNKSYLNHISAQLKKADQDGVELSRKEVIELALMIQPLRQSLKGIVQDAANTNRKVMEPTFPNLVRWTSNPGRYDMAGVDIRSSTKFTVKSAKKGDTKRILKFLGI